MSVGGGPEAVSAQPGRPCAFKGCDGMVLKSFLRNSAQSFYVYVLHRADGDPFYVGKGQGFRVLEHEAEARNTVRLTHKLNVIRKLQREARPIFYEIDSLHVEETAALARERELIRLIGRHDLGLGPLANQTDGGEGTSPSEESRQRHRESLAGENAEDEERRVANRFFQKLTQVGSVTIKPARRFKAEPLRKNRAHFPVSERQAATLAASAIANRVFLAPGCHIPRRLTIDGITFVIENGVGRDMLVSGMATVTNGAPGDESFVLTEAGFRALARGPNRTLLIDAGVLEPEA